MCKPDPPVSTHHLTVGATTANPFPPSLTDDTGFTAITVNADKNTTTFVGPGDTVVWQITEDVSAITAITNETPAVNLFSSGPAPTNDGTGSWSGVIGKLPANASESYSISYNVTGAPANPYTQDPKLSMKT